MKKGLKITLYSLIIFVLVVLIFLAIYYSKTKNNTIATTSGVVVKVNEKSLTVMGTQNVTGLYTVGFTSEGNIGFKQGQEVLIYFNGMVMATYPAQLGKVGKIKIIKEESDTTIPDNILRYCYSSRSNVEVVVSEITSKGLSFTITDKNELPYTYSNEYTLYKKVKNENYTGIGYKIGEDTENSTSGYTGTGLEYIWEEVEKISNILSEDTVKELLYDSSPVNGENYHSAKGIKIDWTDLYGELKQRRI